MHGTRRLALLVGLALVYYVAGRAGLELAFVHKSASAVWPPTGITLAALLLLGPGVWPAILAGAYLVNLDAGPVAAAGIAAGNTIEGVVGAHLVRRFAGGPRVFERVGHTLRYALLAACGATAISATVGTGTLALFQLAPTPELGRIWLTWWLGDATGALVVGPPLILALTEPRPRVTLAKLVEGALLVAGLVAAGIIVFRGLIPAPLLYMCLPFPFWAAFRFGRREATLSALLLSALAVRGTVRGFGPFVGGTPNESLLLLQVFMAVLSVMVLAVATVVEDRRRVERELRERSQELTRSNEALQQFAYAASHDLREPVRTMGSYAELLTRRHGARLGAEADELIRTIIEGAEWMNQLLHGLLEYSKVERRAAAGPTAMDRALAKAMGNLGAAIDETGAKVTSAPLPDVAADDLQMVQLLQNLVANAIKFRRQGVAPEIHVEAFSAPSEWVFSVHDNGIGIDPQDGERIFAMFQRLHQRGDYPGAGVGLAIAKRIVDLHGGRIWVEPRAEGGTTFRFTLPRVSEPKLAPARSST